MSATWRFVVEAGLVSVYYGEMHVHTDFSRKEAETWLKEHHTVYETPVRY